MRIINQQVNAGVIVAASRPWIRLILRNQLELCIMEQKQKREADKRMVNVWFTVIAFGLSCFHSINSTAATEFGFCIIPSLNKGKHSAFEIRTKAEKERQQVAEADAIKRKTEDHVNFCTLKSLT